MSYQRFAGNRLFLSEMFEQWKNPPFTLAKESGDTDALKTLVI